MHKFLSNLTTANQNERQQTPANHVADRNKTVRITSPPKSAPPLLPKRNKAEDSTKYEDNQDAEESSVTMLNGSVGGSRASSRSSSSSASSANERAKFMNISTQVNEITESGNVF